MPEKTLWVVGYQSLTSLIQTATNSGITSLALRTDNNLLAAIPAAHSAGLKLFGWRWPSALMESAMHEANTVANFFAHDLDGYYVDPEGQPGATYDWDQAGLEPVADAFCKTIRAAAGQRPLGMTSHYHAASVFPKLPWSTFIPYMDVFLPQSYWRVEGGRVGNGDPAENYDGGVAAWHKLGVPTSSIVPMAGEIAYSTPAEIAEYAQRAHANNKDLHFYCHTGSVLPAVWTAIKNS